MDLATRPWTTAAVALAGIGVIAVTPVAAPPPPIELHSVQLTTFFSDIDPVTAWQDVVNLADSNATALSDHFDFAPFIALQQVIENQTGYIDGFPGNAGQILPDILANLQAAGTAVINPFTTPTGPDIYSSLTAGTHLLGYHILQGMFTSDLDKELLAFTASPLSSVLVGFLGSIADPALALQDSIQDIMNAPDPQAAFDNLVNIPANIADATLNGQFLDGTAPEIDLTPLLSLLPAGTLPAGVDISSIDVAMGGLLSPGGSLFNAIGVDLLKPITVDVAGIPAGPLGSMVELSQAIAAAIGWDGSASPLGGGLELTTLLDGGALSSDLPALLSGLPTEFGTLTTDILNGLAGLL